MMCLKKMCIAAVTAMLIVTFADTTMASGHHEDFLIDESGTLTGYSGDGGDIVIPDGVMYIGDFAFKNCDSITGVYIPDGVVSIGEGAFAECDGIETVRVPESVESMGKAAFIRCVKLKEITIPDAVSHISNYAFDSCVSLEKVNIS